MSKVLEIRVFINEGENIKNSGNGLVESTKIQQHNDASSPLSNDMYLYAKNSFGVVIHGL